MSKARQAWTRATLHSWDTVSAMAHDQRLIERVRDLLGDRAGISERKMFGVRCFMLDGNLCCGVRGDELMLRLGGEGAEAALAEPAVRPGEWRRGR